ncbi:MAG: carboxypeptidase-like regulatory domain-containing protein [Bacteroidetes bacterium]|nr:carboxypeptidase-like regulatory domain-containing protein [Bacteroidota bacterium]
MKHYIILLTVLFLEFLSFTALSQGSIQGKITDIKTKESIVGASVFLKGTTIGASTDIEGNYLIKNVKPGTYNIVVSFISYKVDTITGVKVTKDKVTTLDHGISETMTQLSEVSVTARKKTDTEISVISASKQSNLIIVGVSSQMIAKSQDKDASEVIRRLPGVTIMGGRFVVVRGLTERYNTVWLNNASTPSSETDQRAFSFDILPSNMIANMVIYKTPAPEIPADFAGAFIQISTKNIPEKNSLGFGYTVGYNDGASLKEFQKYQGGKTDWLGFDDGTRKLPGIIPSTNEVLQLQDYGGGGTPEENAYRKQRMLDIARSFSSISSSTGRTAPLDNKFNVDFSHIFNAGNMKIGNITALSYKLSHSIDEIERLKVESYGTTNSGVTYSKSYQDLENDEGVGIGAISNWSLSTGKSVFEFNNLFNQTGISSTIVRTGIDHYRDDNRVYKTMLGYASRTIYSGSIGGSHNMNEFNSLKWTLGYSYANQSEPDNRLINYYAPKKNDSTYYPFQLDYTATANADGNARLFTGVKENIYNGNVNYQHTFNFGKFTPELKTGIFGERKNRDFYVRPFGVIWAKTGVINQEILHQPIDSVYNETNFNFQDGVIYREVYDPGYQYKIENTLLAGYLALRIPVGKFLNIYGGLRVENNKLVLWGPNANREMAVQTTRDTLNLFPSVNITFNINEKNLIRLAYGRTINRPEFREVAPFAFYNFKENVTVYGNPGIKSCYIDNYDLRYEWYPSPGEMITVGAFYKKFDSPIEATWVPASGGEWDLHYLNALNGNSIGAEVDIRIGLQNWSNKHNFLRTFRNFSFVLNAAYIRSRVETNPEYLFVLDHNRPMYGQSPYIVNAGIYYQTLKNDLSVSLLYNVFGKRIVGIGTPDIPNSYEMPRNILDFTIQKRIGKNLTLKFGVKDILNQEVLIQQTMKTEGLPDVIIKVKAYAPGRIFSFGINYTI